MNEFVDEWGCWIYQGDPVVGIQILARQNLHTPILDFSNIPLSHLPRELAKINGLTDLYLHNNGLTRLPKNLGDIPQLRLLSLGRNQLSVLPESMRQRWDTFEVLYLGDNQFTENPIDEEWMTMFKQGSVGSNPIPEPISPLWMTKQDAQEFPERLSMLFLGTEISSAIRNDLQEQAIKILLNCPEPMIYEIMLKEVWIEYMDGRQRIHWNDFLSQGNMIGLQKPLLNSIPRGSMVHRSLLYRHT